MTFVKGALDDGTMPVTDTVDTDQPPDVHDDQREEAGVHALRTAIAVMRAHYQLAADLIAGEPDPQTAYARSEQLAAAAGDLYTGATTLRRTQVHRIWDAERLSLSALGEQLGLSKQRVAQLLSDTPNRKARKTPTTEG